VVTTHPSGNRNVESVTFRSAEERRVIPCPRENISQRFTLQARWTPIFKKLGPERGLRRRDLQNPDSIERWGVRTERWDAGEIERGREQGLKANERRGMPA